MTAPEFLMFVVGAELLPCLMQKSSDARKQYSSGIVPGGNLFYVPKIIKGSFGGCQITNLKISSKKLFIAETNFKGSINSLISASKISTQCQ
jgi:hypothetical protein